MRDSNNHGRACAAYADALVDFSDNELSADERVTIERHLASCPDCRAELARLDASLACLSHGIATIDMGGRGSRRVLAVPREAGSAGASPSRHWLVATGLAAVCLICLITVWRITRRPIELSKANEPSVVAAPKLSQREALWQIALIEQQARLQTSLDLLPADALSSDEREQTQAIVEQLHNARNGWGDSL